jgi:hypothetical protein
MGWEERGGGRYYYRKRRVNGRVVSEYVGSAARPWVGPLVDLEEANRNERAAERALERARREREQADDAALDDMASWAESLTTALLLAAGCHTHKGTWRRWRRTK